MKNLLSLLLLVGSAVAGAQPINNWVNAGGDPWKNSTGQCWRNSSWTPATAHPDCDGAIKPGQNVRVTITAEPAVVVEAPKPVEPKQLVVTKQTYQAETLFDFDKSVIKPQGKKVLDDLVAKLGTINLEVIIAVGHTDWVGTDAYNMKLGARRAEAVKAYLISKGIEKNRVYTESKGERQPVASNKTREGRAKNRRVEIEVVGTAK